MRPQMNQMDDAFCLEFHTAGNLAGSAATAWMQERMSTDGFLVQERIIIPEHMAGDLPIQPGHALVPERANPPLILIGSSELQLQRALVIARPTDRNTKLQTHDGAITLVADGIHLFFGAPILSRTATHERDLTASFDILRGRLQSLSMQPSDIVRVWLFMDDILGGYAELNSARARFFADWFDLERHVIPASTGIEARHIVWTPMSLECWAFAGDRVTTRRESSPLQNEPLQYDKLFSRALSVQFAHRKILLVSGTASIDKNGMTLHAGDFGRQLRFTLEVVAAILKQAGGSFANVAQAIVYLKRSRDLPDCLTLLDATGFPRERALLQLETHICRDELLCEIEVTAVI